MIKPNDLRIGNWVNVDGIGHTQVKTINSMDFDTSYIQICQYPYVVNMVNDKVTGIQLTDDIIEKHGFKRDIDGCYKMGNCYYYLPNDCNGEFHIAIGYATVSKIRCEYIHQFQNIIYMLTGKELKIEL